MPMFTVPSSFGTLREFNKCHNPAGPGGGQFCSETSSSDARERAFEQELDIKEERVSDNEFYSYLETPKGQSTFMMKNLYGDPPVFELHWLIATKRGAGREAMERIVTLADKHGIELRLWAQPLPGEGENTGFTLPRPRLEAFYKAFGFKQKGRRQRGTAYMVRTPAKRKKAA